MKTTCLLNRLYDYCFIVLLTFSAYANSEEASPHLIQQWEKMDLEVGTWGDGLGYPIDPQIKETVVALNVLGISTAASCEGHLTHGLPYPWVDIDIETPELQNLRAQETLFFNKRDQTQHLLEEKYPKLSLEERDNQPEGKFLLTLLDELRSISSKIEQAKKSRLHLLYSLLQQFYQNHPSTYDRMLIFLDPNGARLQSLGGDWQVLRSEEERKMKLKEYQHEMKNFTFFLKDYFFQMMKNAEASSHVIEEVEELEQIDAAESR